MSTGEIAGIHALLSRSLFGGSTRRRLLLRVSIVKATFVAWRC